MKAPKTIYVKVDKDTDGTLLLEAYADLEFFNESGAVAVYELKSTAKLAIEHVLREK